MSTTSGPPTDVGKPAITLDGFEILDAVHQRTLVALGELEALVTHLQSHGPDAPARAIAADLHRFFSTVARRHHEDEERHIFPPLATHLDPEIVQAVLRLQQDHNWLEEDWMELAPHLDAVASGQTWYDIDVLREGVEVFAALSRDHVALEESCIYPQARRQLDAETRVAMGREMAARRRAGRAKAG